jgi:hypothetical protein
MYAIMCAIEIQTDAVERRGVPMRQRGRFAASILLLVAMTLGICPMRGIAGEIEVQSEGNEVVVDVEPKAEGVVAQSGDDVALEAQDTETVAIVQIVTKTQTVVVEECASVDEALKKWASSDALGSDGGEASLILLQDCTIADDFGDTLVVNGLYKTLDLNGHTLDMKGRTIKPTPDNSTRPTFVLEDSTDSGMGDAAGKLEKCRIAVTESSGSFSISAIFVMASGTLTYDSSTVACVDIGGKGKAVMRGGTITNGRGAGVVVSQGTFVMSGGIVTGCAGGGVNVGTQGVFKVSGAPKVTGNTKEDQVCNVCLPVNKTITVEGALADGANIGVTTATLPSSDNPVTFTADYGSYNSEVFPTKYFFGDAGQAAVGICWNDDTTKKEAALRYHQHNWGCDVAGNVLTATCATENCIAEGGSEQTLTLIVENKAYDGKPASATIQKSAGWAATGASVDVSYYEGDKKLNVAPKDAGAYEARVTVKIAGSEQTVKAPFTIQRVPLTVTAKDKTISYGGEPANAGVTYAGFVGGEDTSALSGALVYDYDGYAAGSPAGSYAITPSGLSSKNYDIAYEAGVLTVKPEPLPGSIALSDVVPVKAVVHVQRMGTLPASTGVGQVVGTTGKSRRLESIRLSLSHQPLAGGIEYSAHVQRSGWQDWRSNGSMAGTQGKARRVEAIRICLTGTMGEQYDVYYRVHAQRYGWMAWAKNGAAAGTQGKSLRVEALQVVVVRKGTSAPGANYNGVAQTYGKAFLNK